VTAETAAATVLARRFGDRPAPETLLVLGSGLSQLVDRLEDAVRIEFSDIPGFPKPSVEGHEGAFILGATEGRQLLVQMGRFHRYEGFSAVAVAMPIRVAYGVGIRSVILTNAAGGIGVGAVPGSVVVLKDQISSVGIGPLMGPLRVGEDRFPDMSAPFDREWIASVMVVAEELGIRLSKGIYGAMQGPAFETPAEIRMLRTLGADVVGMSTVDEVIQARALGMRILGLSLVTNRAAGLREGELAHAEVLTGAHQGAPVLETLIRVALRHLPGGG